MTPRYLLLCLGFLLLVVGSNALAQTFDRDRMIDAGMPGRRQISPNAAVAPDGTLYIVWADYRNSTSNPQVYLSRSTDRGETFTAAHQITNAAGLQAGLQNGPQLVIDRLGNLHLAWQEINEKERVSVRYSRSVDGGHSFSAPLAIGADSGNHNQDFAAIAVDSSGNPFVAWIDTREQETGSSNNAQLFVARSNDGGVSFQEPKRATFMPRGNGGTCECCNTSIAISRSGNIFVSFRSNIYNERDIWIARSLDNGATFQVMKAASETWRINACPMTGSSIAIDRDETAHIVWRDSRPSSQGKDFIYYTSLGISDTACAPDRKISSTTAKSNYPSLAISPEGDLICVFQDTRNDASDVFYTMSTDGGTTFSPDRKLSHETGTSRQELTSVAVAPDGTHYVVWQDTREGAARIMLTRAEPGVGNVANEGRLLASVGVVHPNPVRSGASARLALTLPTRGEVRLAIHDLIGTTVASYSKQLEQGEQSIEIGTTELASGVYFCVMEYAGGREVEAFVVQ